MAKAHKKYTTLLYIINAPVIILAYIITLKFFPSRQNSKGFTANAFFILLALATWYLAAYFSKLYKDRRSNKFSEEIVFIIYTVLIFTILLSSVSFFLNKYFFYSVSFLFPFLFSLTFIITASKYIIRKYIHSAIYQGKLFDNILIVGATPAAIELYETINKYYYYGYKCIGFLDNDIVKLNGCPYKGQIAELNDILSNHQVDEVVIALPNSKSQKIQHCIEICDYHSIKARLLPDFNQYASSAIQVNNIGFVPVINFSSLPLDKLENKLLKRTFDITFTFLFFLTVGFWLLPVIALIIKITSRGHVLFKQERWGLKNEKIVCYKFRTMKANSTDTDKNGIYNQATRNDERVTAFGRLLRKTNMDELPQFWNVLLGNMSVVGPRPHPTPLNIQSMHTVTNYMLRHIILPGITGWAQVNGCRGETKVPGAMQKRVNFDLYYIHRWTFWLDCQIILQTIINVIRGDQNAY